MTISFNENDVHIRAYERVRLGRTEFVREHWRPYPSTGKRKR